MKITRRGVLAGAAAMTVAPAWAQSGTMTLILADGVDFDAFFTKQLTFWDKVVRDNNIEASG